jgi:hypothetical protein
MIEMFDPPILLSRERRASNDDRDSKRSECWPPNAADERHSVVRRGRLSGNIDRHDEAKARARYRTRTVRFSQPERC